MLNNMQSSTSGLPVSTELPNLDEPISYAVDDGAQAGPFTMRAIIESVRLGQRAPDTFVWWAGEAEWVPFNTVSALMTLAADEQSVAAPEPADDPPPPAGPSEDEPTEVDEADEVEAAAETDDAVEEPVTSADEAPAADDGTAEEAVADSDEAHDVELGDTGEPGAVFEIEPEDSGDVDVDESLGAQMFGGHASTEIREAVDDSVDDAGTEAFSEPFEAVENPFAEIDNGELDDVDWSRDDAPDADGDAGEEVAEEQHEEASPEEGDGEEAAAEPDADDPDRSPLELVNDRIEALGAVTAAGIVADADAGEDGDGEAGDHGGDAEHDADGETAGEAEPEPEPASDDAPEVEEDDQADTEPDTSDDGFAALQARSDELSATVDFANRRVSNVADAVAESLSERGYDVAVETAMGLAHRLHASMPDGDDVSTTVTGLIARDGAAGKHIDVAMHRRDASVNLVWKTSDYDRNSENVAAAVNSMLAELERRVGD